ncbi:MAG: DUF1754 domain-containing protein [Kocuria palustris]|jgi:protein FAM32A|nr:DUF1754 domain-containing protein [Kocuria palustris]
MAGDEYSVGGGKLKLKGSKVSGGRIEKKKKKSTKKKDEGEATQSKSESTPDMERPQSEKDEGVTSGEDRERERDAPGKTEAEKRAEEIRRKRVCFLSFFFFPVVFCRAGTFPLRLCWTEKLTFRDSCMSASSAKVSKLIRSVWRS